MSCSSLHLGLQPSNRSARRFRNGSDSDPQLSARINWRVAAERNGLNEVGREEKINTTKAAEKSQPFFEPTPSHTATFILRRRDLADNVACLFVFVEHPEVEPTNHRSEGNARREAEIRKRAPTSKNGSNVKTSRHHRDGIGESSISIR